MLETLDSVNWAHLADAFGPADEVPALLRLLVSGDRDRRLDSLHRLLETVWHQGTVYEVSAHVVPFLCEMLSSPATPDPSLPALVLASLADGSSFLEVHALADREDERSWRAIMTTQGRDFDREITKERSWVRATRQAIEPHLGLLLPYLSSDEPGLRLACASALKHYPTARAFSLPPLRSRLSVETEPYVMDALEEAIEALQSL